MNFKLRDNFHYFILNDEILIVQLQLSNIHNVTFQTQNNSFSNSKFYEKDKENTMTFS